MNTFKVTYKDGTHYTTSANGTLKEFTAYLMQFGGIVTDENQIAGEETRRYIEKVEALPKVGGIYQFENYDGKPATLKVVDVTDQHVWYKWTGPESLHTYPMTLELWNTEEYKLIAS